ncbi:alpha/beta fold hydrolase [Nonomuraea sp. NPDC005983]|uniref:alpha/beta fold hydrolase n=1 Tax=Nonomuraea sp. NPDC005983 TaxID=3155595 RepID=UPI0033B1C896
MLVASAITVGPAAASTAGTIDWKQCAGTDDAIQCATLEVPMDWSKPNGEKIHIGLARTQATDSKSRIGSILMVPGGPGTAGVDVMIHQKGKVFSDAVSKRFDVVTYDPRGVNTSSRVKCDLTMTLQTEQLKTPGSQAEFDKLVAANKKLSEDCRAKTGPLYDHLDSRDVVRDIDAIRAALGEDKITQVGYSYGTLANQQYAEMYPNRVRALVADANLVHTMRGPWDWMNAHTAVQEKNFLAFADWCDQASGCALYGKDTKKTYGELRERARKGDLVNPNTGKKVNFYDLTERIFLAHVPSRWKRLASELKALNDGEKSDAPKQQKQAKPAEDDPLAPLPHGVYFCRDFTFKVNSYAQWKTWLARLAKLYPNTQWTSFAKSGLDCTGWMGQTTNPQSRPNIKGAPPLVMIGNVHDFAADYPSSQLAAEQTGATLVTYEGYGHAVYPTSGAGPVACVNDVIDDYLINLKVPAKGTSCPDIEEP